jgi:nucleotide-binding universal stress UspA family protein
MVSAARSTPLADPTYLVIAEVKSLGADLLMMGADGHRGWRQTVLGSCTPRLLSDCPAPLFIHR